MRKAILIPILFTCLMWTLFIIHFFTNVNFSYLGIHPRDSHTIIGIFTAPLIHGNWEHLISNTLPILILGSILLYMNKKIGILIFICNYLITGLLVWCFARGNSYHIGASGIIYGMASFLLFNGFFRMDIKSIAIASGVALFYGGMVWGIIPEQAGISWESHLAGSFSGFVLAFIFRNWHKDDLYKIQENETMQRKTFEEYINR